MEKNIENKKKYRILENIKLELQKMQLNENVQGHINCWIKLAENITQTAIIASKKNNDYASMKINFNVKIESEHELDDLLNINGLTKYVDLNYTRSEIEKRWPFLKKLWASGMSFYSYSVKKINEYFGREVLQKDTPTMSAYVINYLINLFNKEKYWDET